MQAGTCCVRIFRPHHVTGAVALGMASLLSGEAGAQSKQLTLCWAAWDPANALVELSKDFTAKSGIQMKFEFVPWTSYADRFLKQMVRSIEGTLVEVGQRKRAAGDMQTVLTAKARAAAGRTAPAHGLYLVKVDYENVQNRRESVADLKGEQHG